MLYLTIINLWLKVIQVYINKNNLQMRKLECVNISGKKVRYISNDGRLEFVGKAESAINEQTGYGVVVRNPTCYFINKKGVHVDNGISLEREYRWVYFINKSEQSFPENSWFKDDDILTRNSRLKDVKDAELSDYETMKSYNPDLYQYIQKHIRLDSFNNLSVRDKEHINTAIDETDSSIRMGKTAIDDNSKTTVVEKNDAKGKTAVDNQDDGRTGIIDSRDNSGKTSVADDNSVEGKTTVDNKNNISGKTTV